MQFFSKNYSVLCIFLFMGAIVALAGSTSSYAEEEVPIWSDSMNGFALGGYDPVSYFTRRKATIGLDRFQYDQDDIYWRFENSGNMEVFKKHPHVYTPQFSGYDPYALAKGRTIRGQPQLWTIYRKRLFIFHNIINQRLWHDDKDKYIVQAIEAWPKLSKNILRKIEVD